MTNLPTNSEQLAILGGRPVCSFPWPKWPVHDKSEEIALLDVLHSGEWWFGDRVTQFENEFAAFQGAQYAVSCTNGTTAIEMALRALGIVEGDEVIVPPYTFIATASAVVTIGAIPVFADILPDTLCLDPQDAERKITARTRAIIPVHVGGLIADMRNINAMAAKHGLVVLEDAAHAWGSELDGQGAGTLGAAGTFSFQETKNMTAGEGGVLVTNDREIADLCRAFSHCGRTAGSAWYDHNVLGSNLRLTEFQAAVLLAQLNRLENQIGIRERNASLITEFLSTISAVQPMAATQNMTRRSYHMYIMRINQSELGISRDRFIESLLAEGVPVSSGWYRPLYGNRVFQNAHIGPVHGVKAPLANKRVNYTQTSCPICEQVCQDAVWIPQDVLLAEEPQIHQLGEAIRKVVRQADSLRT